MWKWRECLEEIEDEIEELIEDEAEEITAEGQDLLHAMLENRRHIMDILAEKGRGVAG